MSGEAKEGPVDLQVVVQFDADADPFNSRPTMEERGTSDNQPSSDSSASSVLDVTENRGRVYTGDGYEKTFLKINEMGCRKFAEQMKQELVHFYSDDALVGNLGSKARRAKIA
ncbi:hypothetical protein B0H13DRAFT_1878691 [Mycena leptocephala]|nr:hypothetical protein B0H13DRAFT_1878691 [Mycena leptocephala]